MDFYPKSLSPQLKMIILIFMLGLTWGIGQVPPVVENTWILRNVIDSLDKLSLQLKEFEEKVEAKFEGLQQCSTEAQLSQFQEHVFKDDCEEGSHTCGDMSTCTDYFNRYECSCLPGYSGDGITCQDVDECSENNNICGDHGTCQNNPGSYTCACDKYFRYVGNICQGPVCESPSLFVPEIGCLTLVRERMPWDECKSKCQEMGLRLAEGLQRRHFQVLSDHFYPIVMSERYYGPWIGLRHRQWLNQEEENKIQEEDWYQDQPNGDLDQCGIMSLHPSSIGLGDDQCSYGFFPLCQSLP